MHWRAFKKKMSRPVLSICSSRYGQKTTTALKKCCLLQVLGLIYLKKRSQLLILQVGKPKEFIDLPGHIWKLGHSLEKGSSTLRNGMGILGRCRWIWVPWHSKSHWHPLQDSCVWRDNILCLNTFNELIQGNALSRGC